MASIDSIGQLDSAYKNRTINAAETKNSKLGNSDLGLSDFITLLVAQLKNQDMMNPMSDTDFIAQMAQFSGLQAMTTLSETNNTAYAASLIGKKVTAASLDENGALQKVEGNVTGVSLFEGKPIIYIGDKAFDLNQIMVVGELPTIDESTDPEDNGESTNTDGNGESTNGDVK